MIDGLSTEEMNVGSVTSSLISGADLKVGKKIATSEIEADAVGLSELNDVVSQAGTDTLSSGSKWVVFGTAFTNPPYVVVSQRDAQDADVEIVGTASIAAGSFLAVGSVTDSTAKFDWIGFGSR